MCVCGACQLSVGVVSGRRAVDLTLATPRADVAPTPAHEYAEKHTRREKTKLRALLSEWDGRHNEGLVVKRSPFSLSLSFEIDN